MLFTKKKPFAGDKNSSEKSSHEAREIVAKPVITSHSPDHL